MSAHVLLNLLNEVRKNDKMRGLLVTGELKTTPGVVTVLL